MPNPSDDDPGHVGSSSMSAISDADWISTQDILGLEVIAEQMFEKIWQGLPDILMVNISISVWGKKIENDILFSVLTFCNSDAELRQYTPLAEADFGEIEKTDSFMEQAYELYLTPLYLTTYNKSTTEAGKYTTEGHFDGKKCSKTAIENVPRIKRKTKAMIERLQKEPHFYCPYEREEPTNVHVSRWINKYTSNPQRELLGFTSKDPFEPKRCISSVEPRVSISDTNVLLGKRKRKMDEDDTECVSKCSSETKLVCDRVHRTKRLRNGR